MSTWEERMADRAQERRQRAEEPAAFDPVDWRKSNVVFGSEGEILYPGGWMPCPTCGQELPPEGWLPKGKFDHPVTQNPDADEEERAEECCFTCGYHESYHRAHDCVKDYHEPFVCACSGGQPWACCVNVAARQEQFLYQRAANVLLAGVHAKFKQAYLPPTE